MKKNIINLFKNKKLRIVEIALAVGIIAVICIWLFAYNSKPKADTEYMNALLSKSSELTTAKLNYTGMTKYEDTGVSIINKADFIMVYKATVRAGINVDEVKITADDANKIIYVSIPSAVIQEVKVDTSSIEYFDEKFAIFNTDEKEDSNTAIALAESSAMEEAANMGILEWANEQSATLVSGILANAIPDGYEIKVK